MKQNHRSTRESFQVLLEKRKTKNREEERASGIAPELTDIDKLLDELIKVFPNNHVRKGHCSKGQIRQGGFRYRERARNEKNAHGEYGREFKEESK